MRRVAREIVFKLIFEYTFYDKKNDGTKEMMMLDSNLNNDDKKFIENTYDGILKNQEDIKNEISNNLESYKIERVYRPDLVVLMLATYEIKYSDVPKPVIINEAVDLSKKYGTEKSGKFVNGVLGRMIK